MEQIKVFLDSDVIVSAILSSKGASFEILQNTHIKKVISEVIRAEVTEVMERLKISSGESMLQGITIMKHTVKKTRIAQMYIPYVLDEEDSHVVAGAHRSTARFLLTHNVKHYHVEKIKQDFNVITMKPGVFLQYLRRTD